MSCCGNSYYPFVTENERPNVPYGSTSYFQSQAPLPGTAPGMLPAGAPGGPSYGGSQPTPGTSGAGSQMPQTLQNPYFLAGQLRKYIGRNVRVEFLMGSSGPLIDRVGTLLEVGASYITLRPANTDDTLVCDFFSIRFVTVYG